MSMTNGNIFPNTDTYLIFYDPGSGGNFIRNLIGNLYFGINFDPSEFGDSHSFEYPRNVTKRSIGKYMAGVTQNIGGKELVLDPEDETLPFIIISHDSNLNINRYFKKFPKGKIICITCDEIDQPRLNVNWYFKGFVNLFPQKKPITQVYWAGLKKKFPFLINRTDPLECTIEEFQIMFSQLKFDIKFNSTFIDNMVIDKSKFINLPYRTMLKNPSYVLEQLCVLTGKNINEHTYTSYQKYIDSQQILIEKYAPWILGIEQV